MLFERVCSITVPGRKTNPVIMEMKCHENQTYPFMLYKKHMEITLNAAMTSIRRELSVLLSLLIVDISLGEVGDGFGMTEVTVAMQYNLCAPREHTHSPSIGIKTWYEIWALDVARSM